jgi:hypothetical protein
MNKEKALERLDAIESEAKELREIIKAPERRTPKAGDVWKKGTGYQSNYLMCNASPDGILASNLDSNAVTHFGEASSNPLSGEEFTYLGKFDEVYVKISDVRAALSHEDNWGDSVLATVSVAKGISMGGITTKKTRDALRKLNII